MSAAARPARELVYCHQCENEWYRDEHGLVCPDCQSDVVEIIEAEHDPRQEMHEEEMDQSPFGGMLSSVLRAHAGAQAGDQTYGGPGQPTVTREESTSPDGRHVRSTVRVTAGPEQSVQSLFHSMFQQIGGMTPEQAMHRRASGYAPGTPQTNPTPGSPPGTYSRPPPPEPYTRDPPPPPAETRPPQHQGPHVQTQQYRWGPFNLSMTTSTNTIVNGRPMPPFGAGGPQQTAFGDDDMNGILRSTFEPMMPHFRPGSGRTIIYSTSGNAQGGGAAINGLSGPLGMLLSTLGVPAGGGHMGDVAFSEQHLDRIISQLMEQNQQSTAPGPAPAEAIEALPRIKVTKDMIDESTGEADCPVCLSSCDLGEEVAQLPCKHWFHFECVKSWLETHDTCPSCRRGILAQGEENRVRETGETPRHWQREAPSPDLSRTNTEEETAQPTRTGSTRETAPRLPSHSYGNPTQAETSRWRSRSPTRVAGDQSGSQANTTSARDSISAGIRNAVRNGIWNWMGRNTTAQNDAQSSSRADQTTSQTTPVTQQDARAPTAGQSTGTTHGVANNRNQSSHDATHGDLDVPDVD